MPLKRAAQASDFVGARGQIWDSNSPACFAFVAITANFGGRGEIRYRVGDG